jgi:hypothetical protein
MSDNTQLTSASGYDIKNMIFSDAQSGSIPNSLPAINYKRISISTRNEDGTVGELIIPTSKLFSFGVNENINKETGKVNGYVIPICLWDREGPSDEEKDFSDTFDRIVESCKSHLISNREEIDQYELEMNDLKKFNPLHWKRDKGKIVDGSGPTMYTKLIVSKKHNKIVSMFYNEDGDEVDPLSIIGKYCYTKAAIKIESIFIGNKISLQVKLYETEVKLVETGMKRMMKKRPESQSQVIVSKSMNPLENESKDEDGDSDGSLNDEDESPPPQQEPKKVVRKVKRVVRKSNVD